MATKDTTELTWDGYGTCVGKTWGSVLARWFGLFLLCSIVTLQLQNNKEKPGCIMSVFVSSEINKRLKSFFFFCPFSFFCSPSKLEKLKNNFEKCSGDLQVLYTQSLIISVLKWLKCICSKSTLSKNNGIIQPASPQIASVCNQLPLGNLIKWVFATAST